MSPIFNLLTTELFIAISLVMIADQTTTGLNTQLELENQAPQKESAPVSASGSSSTPYWHRFGCFKVGHTRTISIPGCVKFNISTNACRGHCMSFSVPSGAMDDGQLIQTGIDVELLKGLIMEELGVEAVEPAASRALLDDNRTTKQLPLDINSLKRRYVAKRATDGGGGGENNNNKVEPLKQLEVSHQQRLLQYPMVMQQPTSQTSQGLSGIPSETSQLRPIISVSQCCSMMDTEEVVVNVRCGASEVRRLVFNSAKSCECFFCKHH